MNKSRYWATAPANELVSYLKQKVDDFDNHLDETGLMAQLKQSYAAFYGDTSIQDAGSQGQLKAMKINHYASLIRNMNALVTSQKVSWQAVAANTDVESQSAAILATGLLDYYMKQERLDRTFKNAALQATFLREAWVSTTWDVSKGEIIAVDPDTNTPVNEGSLAYNLFLLPDVIRDFNRTDSQHDWLITRNLKNKYELMAQFPEYEDIIGGITSDAYSREKITIKPVNHKEQDSDLIHFYTFYFRPSTVIPNGRMVQFVDGQVLTDGPLPYEGIPLVRIAAEDMTDSPFGHAPMLDILPLQQGIDTLGSILLSNNAAFGVQNIKIPKGSGISVTQINDGLNVMEYDKNVGGPEPLQLTASAPETYRFLDTLVSQAQQLSGINDAVRGQAPAGTSGAALALLSQQAIQFANGLQQSYISLAEDVGTMSVQILQEYANTKRVAQLVGKHNRPLLREWSKEDIQGVSRVTIEAGSAFSKSAAGRLQIADSLMQAGMIKRPEQYIAVLETGRLEPIYENESRELLLIRSENEKLADGQAVRALITDNHQSHILEHASVLSSPEARDNPNSPMILNTLAHIQEHLGMAQNMPPALAMILKQQPLPPDPMMAPQGMDQQGPVPQAMDAANPVVGMAQEVNMPSMPTNPATGEEFTGAPIN
ncbi:hypothetical protein ACES2J_08320 [Bdellovibrio bacteriovorus]|uniref:hypothetical protein n=1 Tax=Bdellovibrio bacteriovorus TaxID=959 RepID=UPI0035A5CBD2